MKVAIVHDYIKEYGGAERVVEALLEVWPKAHVYTSMYIPQFLGPHKSRVERWDIRTSFLQHIPMKGKLISPFRFIAPWVFKTFDLSDYDLVIVSAAGTYTNPNFVKVGEKTLHICYCHTPPRYLYGYSTAVAWDKVWWRKLLLFLGRLPMHFIRMADYNSAQRPDYFIANSKEVAARIDKFYRRKATVIYPPVDIKEAKKHESVKKGKYYLAGGRLARAKRPELAVEACTKLKKQLIVFGRGFGGYGKQLRRIAGDTVDFVGEVTDFEKWELMANAKAFIFPADLEDFGITPVEAMAAGTPVIANKSGGVIETVIEGKTGTFFNKSNVKSVMDSIRKFEKMSIKKEDCVAQADKFSDDKFKNKMKMFVEKHAKK